MYKEFFGLNNSPFELSPDPSFMFLSEKSKDALASISYAISRRKGFIVMTGEVGTGKTMILRCLFELWEREQIPFAYFIGPRLSTMDFLRYLAYELGIKVTEPTKGNLLRALYGFLLAQFDKDLTTILIIDEAHQMPQRVLEEIRLLANFETAQQKLLQILLVGQPELDRKLDSVELRSLKQRIAVRCQLEPLGRDEIHRYIEHRLELAGADSRAATIFPADTVNAIYHYSTGIPRLISSICDQALMAAYARGVRVVPVEIIDEVATRFRLDDLPPNLKETEQPFSSESRTGSSTPDGSLQVTPALDVATVTTPDPDAIIRRLEVDNGRPTRIVAPNKPETEDAKVAFLSSDPPIVSSATVSGTTPRTACPPVSAPDRAPTAESIFLGPTATKLTARKSPIPQTAVSPADRRGVFRSNHILSAARPFQLHGGLTPALRLSLLVCAVAVVTVALVTGVLMARRQKRAVVVPHQVASTRETFPVGQTIALTQSAGASPATWFEVDSLDSILPRPSSRSSNSIGEMGHLTPRRRFVMGSLMGMQTKELDLSKGLLGVSLPASPGTNTGDHLQLPKLVLSPASLFPARVREK